MLSDDVVDGDVVHPGQVPQTASGQDEGPGSP